MALPDDMLITALTWILDGLTAVPTEATGVGWVLEFFVDALTAFLSFYKKYKQIKEMLEKAEGELSFSNFVKVIKEKGKTLILLNLLEFIPFVDILPLYIIADLINIDVDEEEIQAIIGAKKTKKGAQEGEASA